MPLLAQSLNRKMTKGDISAARLWNYATRALHNIALNPDCHHVLTGDADVANGLLAIAAGRGEVGVLFQTRRLAADAAVALRLSSVWAVERLIWLALLKGSLAECPMAKIPSQLIRPIMMWVVLLGTPEGGWGTKELEEAGAKPSYFDRS